MISSISRIPGFQSAQISIIINFPVPQIQFLITKCTILYKQCYTSMHIDINPPLLSARPLTSICQARPRHAGPCRSMSGRVGPCRVVSEPCRTVPCQSGLCRRVGLTLEHPREYLLWLSLVTSTDAPEEKSVLRRACEAHPRVSFLWQVRP